eukprot:gene3820-4753_t
MDTNKLIDFYGAYTSNAWKIFILLEELGIEFNYHSVNIRLGEQFKPEFLKLNPNNKIPVIVDRTLEPPLVVFESGAILQYFAQKYGKLLPDPKLKLRENTEVLQWLSWQISGLGPFLGQASHFIYFAPDKQPYSIERYSKEADRLLTVLDKHLEGRDYVAGGEFSIADISIWGWAIYVYYGWLPNRDNYKNINRYISNLNQRPSIKKTLEVFDRETKPFRDLHNIKF